MPQPFKPGDRVQQVLPPPITGVIIGYSLDQSNGDVSFHVGWKDAQGEIHTRYFTGEQIEAAKETAPEPEVPPQEGGAP